MGATIDASGEPGSQLRWRLALCAVDRLFSALGLSLEEKRNLAREMARARRQDFVVDRTYKDQVAHKFRDQRQTLAKLLRIAGAANDLLPTTALAALSRYSARLRVIRTQLESLHRAGKLATGVPDLAFNFAHMHFNRMFRSRHQEQEALVCELLSRAYDSELARSPSPVDLVS
jgi:thiopeptide-type bacteriocin biosynthesis protein